MFCVPFTETPAQRDWLFCSSTTQSIRFAVTVVAEDQPSDFRRLRLRFAGTCAECGIALSPGSEGWHSKTLKQVVCLACRPDTFQLFTDAPGASALAEGERRKDRRVEEVRKQHGDYAAAVAEVLTAKDVASSWGKGSDGESYLANFVTTKVGDTVIALHDRLIPGTRANIDHVWVSPSGVWIVDAKSYKGKVVKRDVGSIWKRDHEVFVNGRNRSKLARGMELQIDAVKAAIRLDPELQDVDIYAALCFVDSEWGLLDGPFSVGKVWVTYPRALAKALRRKGPMSRQVMEHIARRLDLSLPRAG